MPAGRPSTGYYLERDFNDYQDINGELIYSVEQAYQAGLIKGYDDGTLRPKDNVTRAEAVVLLDRARELKRYYEQQTPTPTPSVTPTATPSATPTATVTPSEEAGANAENGGGFNQCG